MIPSLPKTNIKTVRVIYWTSINEKNGCVGGKNLRSGFKTQPPVDRRFCPVPPGFYCSKQWQPPGTGRNRRLGFEAAPYLDRQFWQKKKNLTRMVWNTLCMLPMSYSSFISQKSGEIVIFGTFWAKFSLNLTDIVYSEVGHACDVIVTSTLDVCTYCGIYGKGRPIASKMPLDVSGDHFLAFSFTCLVTTPLVKRCYKKGLVRRGYNW